MANELSPKEKRQLSSKQLAGRVTAGMRQGGPMGALAGFMGVPFYSRGFRGENGPAGQMYFAPDYGTRPVGAGAAGGIPAAGAGNNGGSGSGSGNGNGNTPVAPDALGELGKVGGFPQWYIDWYKSQGVYGGVPPVQGLL